MENSMSEPEVQRSFRSPPRRRRSTFFEKRDSMVPTTQSENENPITNKNETELTRHHDMTSYYNKLLSEKEQWKKEVKERRNKYHDLREQYQIVSKSRSQSSIPYSALSDEDIKYLKGKPTISKLIDVQQKLHKSVKETIALVRRTHELEDVILSNSERKVKQVSDYIFENSTVD